MLKSLYISSFVIIDTLHVDFYDGMSVLTGETGAGKSIIIDALGQLCGNRSSSSLVRKGCSKAIIEGIFELNESEELNGILEELNIDLDDELVITKEITSNGKSSIKINYRSSSNQALKLLAPYLMDIHSQFETQKLFEERNHLVLLDEYCNLDLIELKDNYKELYKQYKHSESLLNKAIHEDMSDEQLEFLESQLQEIEDHYYSDEEVDEMNDELKVLQNYEKVNEKISYFEQAMNHSNGVLVQLNEAIRQLSYLEEFEQFNESYENLYDYYYNIKEEYQNVMDTFKSMDFDEYRFNELQDILYHVSRLKRKYGLTMERVYEYKEDLIERIDMIKNREEYIFDLENQVKKEKQLCLNIARKIHDIRASKALLFERDIINELKSLYLNNAKFKIEILEKELSSEGIDHVRFKVAINKGQEFSLLNESASGGEISRIMLAIKTIIFKYNCIDTIIFDEVDTGVSGKVASSIGEKMKSLSHDKQVICITHLPQVASLAKYHYVIEKNTDDETTVSSVKQLTSDNERIKEIANMLSGEQVSKEAIENAKKLLNV